MDGVLPRNLEREDLDIICQRKIRNRIADEIIGEWDLVGRELDVSDKKLKSIREDCALTLPERKAIALLDAWAEEHGNGATCLKLAEALYRRKKTRVIEVLCDEVTQMKHETTNTSGAGAAMCLKPSDKQQQEEGLKNVDSAVEVRSRIKDLELQFNVIHGRILTELEKEGSNTAVDVPSRINDLERLFSVLHEGILAELEEKQTKVSDILHSVTLLPIAITPEYKPAITEIFPDLRRETTIGELFYHISPMVDFLGYGLLEYIINKFGSNTLKNMMAKYGEVVVQFMKKTTVKQLMDHWPGKQEIPPNFSKLQAKIDQDRTTYSLYRLDQLRKRYCCELKLSNLIFVIIGLEVANSFIVEWLVPSALVPQLEKFARQVNLGFYLRERMLKVVVGEKQIFPFLPDSKSGTPTATTVTVNIMQSIRDQLSDSSVYSGVAIMYEEFVIGLDTRRLERTLSKLNFKVVALDRYISSQVDLKTLLYNFAQCIAYPASGSNPFVIAVFVEGLRCYSPSSLDTPHGSVDIVDDIIKPFLPNSAPHLVHIPKLFFISSWFGLRNLDVDKPLFFPGDNNANYYTASYLARWRADSREWMDTIADNLLSGGTMEGVIDKLQSRLNKKSEQLNYFSCLKEKL